MAIVRNLVPLDIVWLLVMYSTGWVTLRPRWVSDIAWESRGAFEVRFPRVNLPSLSNQTYCLCLSCRLSVQGSARSNRGLVHFGGLCLPVSHERSADELVKVIQERYYRELKWSSSFYSSTYCVYRVLFILTVYIMISIRRLVTRQTLARVGLITFKNPRVGNGVGSYSRSFSTSPTPQSQRTRFINALIEENGPGTSPPSHDWRSDRLQINWNRYSYFIGDIEEYAIISTTYT